MLMPSRSRTRRIVCGLSCGCADSMARAAHSKSTRCFRGENGGNRCAPTVSAILKLPERCGAARRLSFLTTIRQRPARWARHNSATGYQLSLAKIFANRMQVVIKFLRMLVTNAPDFFNNRIMPHGLVLHWKGASWRRIITAQRARASAAEPAFETLAATRPIAAG